MPTNILMPALSPTMEEGKLAKWLKKEGDTVKAGDVIAEIETDKATMEVEAVDEGTVARILVPEGTENVKVNTPIARLAGEGAAAAPAPAAAAPKVEAPKADAPKAAAPPPAAAAPAWTLRLSAPPTSGPRPSAQAAARQTPRPRRRGARWAC